jgi:light-harvesting complex I chlorophyll a/b binding protein 1
MLYLTSALAATAAFQAASLLPSSPAAVARVTDVSMFTGGARAAPKKRVAPKKKAPPTKAAPAAAKGLFSGGLAPAKAKTKLAVSSAPTAQTYIDVTGGEYIENAQTFGMPQYDEIGVLPPLGRWDPLQIREQGPERYRRFVEMEIKHGRLAMAGFLGVVTTYSGIRWPGYLSKAEDIKFTDIPGGAIASWAALPTAAWFQIVLFVSVCETLWLKQDPNKDAGDVVPEGVAWARYPDGYDVWLGDGSTKQVGEDELILGKTWKLNAERNNGRAAMMGITGMIIHEALTGNPIFPIGETL